MKKTITTAFLALIVTTGATASTEPVEKTVNVKESTITWTGKKVLGQHTGTINLKSGTLEMVGDLLVGGSFVVDMTTITVTDLKAGEGKEKLEGHLNSADFFDTTNHNEATFVITEVAKSGNGYSVVGDLTIKGTTLPTTVNMTIENGVATTVFNVDRTKYGVRYGSASFFDNLKDNAISDNFELAVSLTL